MVLRALRLLARPSQGLSSVFLHRNRFQSTIPNNTYATILERLPPSDVLRLVTHLSPLALHAHEKYVELQSIQSTSSVSSATIAELRQLGGVARITEDLINIKRQFDDALSLLKDPSSDQELLFLAQEERQRLDVLVEEKSVLLISALLKSSANSHQPSEFSDDDHSEHTDHFVTDKCAILEVRAGTGGDEAALFAAELVDMYTALSRRLNWQIRTLSRSSTDLKGIRDAVMRVSGSAVYSTLSTEAGVHRVQRVPATETQGRVHTSTASVAVLRDAPHRRATLHPSDVRFDVFRASGAGGQHVNTTESAVRAIHIPTGIVATCQDERSQHRNRAMALETLAIKVSAKAEADAAARRVGERRAQLGAVAGERGDRIRTYNFPQRRVTDHRIVPDDRIAAIAPAVKEAIGSKNASVEQIMEGGEQLDLLMASVKRSWECAELANLLEEADKKRTEESDAFLDIFVNSEVARLKHS